MILVYNVLVYYIVIVSNVVGKMVVLYLGRIFVDLIFLLILEVNDGWGKWKYLFVWFFFFLLMLINDLLMNY